MKVLLVWLLLTCAGIATATPKQHVVAFGKPMTVKVLTSESESPPVEMKVRPLMIDGRVKEFVTGPVHDVTDRVFVVQRAYRFNDLLPHESGPSRWQWQRGGWLLVDRIGGRVQAVSLPGFDAYCSQVSWFRDYAAYCGVSDDGSQRLSVVAQLGRRKPLLKKAIKDANGAEACSLPTWSRAPARVTFDVPGELKFTFTVRSHAVDVVSQDEDQGGD